jgi:hypothetical protein
MLQRVAFVLQRVNPLVPIFPTDGFTRRTAVISAPTTKAVGSGTVTKVGRSCLRSILTTEKSEVQQRKQRNKYLIFNPQFALLILCYLCG